LFRLFKQQNVHHEAQGNVHACHKYLRPGPLSSIEWIKTTAFVAIETCKVS
jgi:hypothetical protein